MAVVYGIGNRTGNGSVRGDRLGAGVHVHAVAIQLDRSRHLVSIGANDAHVRLIGGKNKNLTEWRAEGGRNRNGMARHRDGGYDLVVGETHDADGAVLLISYINTASVPQDGQSSRA